MVARPAAPRIAVPEHLSAAAFAGHDDSLPIVDLAGETMGTYWTVRFAAPRGCVATAIQSAIEARLGAIVDEMSHWRPDSTLCRFNAAPEGCWLSLPPDFAHVIAAGIAVAEASDGAFDPAMGRLTDLWGIGPRPATSPPSQAAIAAALGQSGWRRLAFDPAARRLRQPGGLWLDLSGIAKGHAVDAVADLLAAHGVAHALVEIGGELAGRGVRPDLDPWWVDLETPAAGIAPLRIALHQLAIATSGDYVRGPHTIDPRTGMPLIDAMAVSVCHPSAMIADAWATALSVAGAIDGPRYAERHGIAARWIWRDGDGHREILSPAFAAML